MRRRWFIRQRRLSSDVEPYVLGRRYRLGPEWRRDGRTAGQRRRQPLRNDERPVHVPHPINYVTGYDVTVLTQPAGQTCTIAGAAGAYPGTSVSNVQVTCT